jgi:hypothetical protein
MALHWGFIGYDINIREEKKLIIYVCECVCVLMEAINGRQRRPLVVAINDSIIVNFT